MAAVSPGVYKKVLRVREAYPFDIACLLMRFFGSMLNIGVVTMITLSGYSFLTAGRPWCPRPRPCRFWALLF